MLVSNATEKRRSQRFSHPEYVIVKAKISDEEFWKEKATLKSVSRLGAGFDIEKPCKVGQLISLLIPMPPNLRLYDHDKQLYRIWGLVQHCHGVSYDDFTGYNVGVAFIGKDAPQSFYERPEQSYRIVGLSEEGVWKITEAEREFVNRKHPRLWVSIPALLKVENVTGETDETGEPTGEKNDVQETDFIDCQTENISRSGAAVFCETPAVVGDHVKFSCPQMDFVTDAIVRNRRGNGNTIPKIHLEFIENEFPVEKLELNFEAK